MMAAPLSDPAPVSYRGLMGEAFYCLTALRETVDAIADEVLAERLRQQIRLLESVLQRETR